MLTTKEVALSTNPRYVGVEGRREVTFCVANARPRGANAVALNTNSENKNVADELVDATGMRRLVSRY